MARGKQKKKEEALDRSTKTRCWRVIIYITLFFLFGVFNIPLWLA
jgi:uncharacterized membrane protein YiaA